MSRRWLAIIFILAAGGAFVFGTACEHGQQMTDRHEQILKQEDDRGPERR